MGLDSLIRKLQKEREHLDTLIASLGQLRQAAAVTMPARVPKRRGRKFMDEKGRQEVSERMKCMGIATKPRRRIDGRPGSAIHSSLRPLLVSLGASQIAGLATLPTTASRSPSSRFPCRVGLFALAFHAHQSDESSCVKRRKDSPL